MRVLEELDVLGDEALQVRIFRLSLLLLVATLLLALGAGLASGADGGALATLGWWGSLAAGSLGVRGIAVSAGFAAGSLVALPVHELVHGAAFKLLCRPCEVSFGAQGPFLYTRTNDACATRPRMVAVLLAPSVVVTSALVAAALAAGAPALAVLLAGVHLSGCASDMLMAADALRAPDCTHVRDTDVGIDLLSDKELL